MQQQRRRFKQLLTLQERLDEEAMQLRARAEKLPHGPERERIARKARQTETAMRVDEWLALPGLRAPK